jgi:hypothetical protein
VDEGAAALDLAIDVELGAGAIEVMGFETPFLAGSVPFLIIKSAWVTSKADSC